MNKEKLLLSSMKMISNAGDAREYLQSCVNNIANNNFDEAYTLLVKANDKLKISHIEQTHVLQTAMESEDENAAKLLFSHAQDTLMTINSEYFLISQMIGIYKNLNNRIKELESKYE